MTHKTVVDLFEARINRSGPKMAAQFPAANGWESLSWNQWWESSERVAAGLVQMGIQHGDRIVILAETRVEWAIIDMAIFMAGAVSVPIFPSHLPDAVAHIINDCNARFVFVEDPSQAAKVALHRKELRSVRHVVSIDLIAAYGRPDWNGNVETRMADIKAPRGWLLTYDELLDKGRRQISTEHKPVVARRTELTTNDLATIVYTSGTGATPKGVELTHDNLVNEVEALRSLEMLSADDVQLLFLPMAHIFARILYLTAVGYGLPTAFLGDITRLTEALQGVNPTFFAGVPHVFEKIRNRLLLDAHRFGGLRGALFDAAYVEGKSAENADRPTLISRAKLKLFDELVFKRIRDMFGGRLRMLISGGAVLPPELAEFYFALGIPILEGYGLTETTAVATVNVVDEYRIGTVGRPLPGVEVTIAEDGEVLVRGKTVMRGYHQNHKASKDAIDPEGWLHTGDIGEYDRDGFLKITGRKKDIIVTAGGKNIAPQAIESLLAASPLIEHAMVFGEGRPFIVALLTLDAEQVKAWAEQGGLPAESWVDSPRVREVIQAHVDTVNSEFATYSTVKRFRIIPGELSIEGNELTPTNKLRRQIVAEKFCDTIEALYKEV